MHPLLLLQPQLAYGLHAPAAARAPMAWAAHPTITAHPPGAAMFRDRLESLAVSLASMLTSEK